MAQWKIAVFEKITTIGVTNFSLNHERKGTLPGTNRTNP